MLIDSKINLDSGPMLQTILGLLMPLRINLSFEILDQKGRQTLNASQMNLDFSHPSTDNM